MQFVEIAASPMGGDEPENSDEAEDEDKDGDRSPIHGGLLRAGLVTSDRGFTIARAVVDQDDDQRGQDDPEKLIPIEKWDAEDRRLKSVVKRHRQQREKGNDEQHVPPFRSGAIFRHRSRHSTSRRSVEINGSMRQSLLWGAPRA